MVISFRLQNRKLIRVQWVLDREFLSLRNTDGTPSIIHVSNTVSMDVKSSKLNAPVTISGALVI